jgi:hypothetical protein
VADDSRERGDTLRQEMTNENQAPQLDPYRWGTILGVLSLDVARPYVADMGLQLPPGDKFVAGLREIIRGFRAQQAQRPVEEHSFAQTIFEWVSKEYGPAFADHLYQWGENVFQYSGADGAGAFLWNNIVRRGGLKGERDPSAAPELVRLLRSNLAARPERHIGDVQPATDWDRELYLRQGYDEMMNAMEWVKSTVSHYNFVVAWEKTMAAVEDKTDMSQVYQWGKAVAKDMGVPLDQLEAPGSWPPLPTPWIVTSEAEPG